MITKKQANNVMNLLFGKTEYTSPATLYLGLSKSAINEDGTGATEPSGSGYARCAIPNNKTSFSESSNGMVSNKIQFAFEESTGNWGTITHVFIADAATGGNILYYDQLATSRIVQEASSLTFPIGALTFNLTNQTSA